MHGRGCGYREAIAFIVGEPSATPSILATPARQRRQNGRGRRAGEGRVMRPRAPTTTADAMKLWTPAVDPSGTLGEIYLNRDRALELRRRSRGPKSFAGTQALNALLALFRSIATGEPQSGPPHRSRSRRPPDQAAHVHRPRWRRCGHAGRASRSVTTGLHVGEGVETCMAGRQYDLKPTWALGSTVAIAKFAPLAGVECLTLLQENDGGKSERACTACAAPLARRRPPGDPQHPAARLQRFERCSDERSAR